MLPRVILHNSISLDGRIEGYEGDIGLHYRISFHGHVDAVLMGSRTAQSFGPGEDEESAVELPLPEREAVYPGFEELVYEPRPLVVIPDSRGTVHNWLDIWRQPWYRQPIALVSRSIRASYLHYLDVRQVPYIVAGEDHVDLRKALEILGERFGVRSIQTDCGGTLNAALLQAGLADEVSVIVFPALVGDRAARTLFDGLPDLPVAGPIALRLAQVERVAGDALWLRYTVDRR